MPMNTPITLREVNVFCPIHKIPLVWIPKPIADDIVACPDCGAGGSYKNVVEKRTGLTSGFVELGTLQETLREAGYTRKEADSSR